MFLRFTLSVLLIGRDPEGLPVELDMVDVRIVNLFKQRENFTEIEDHDFAQWMNKVKVEFQFTVA